MTYTTREAAAMLGISRRRVQQAAQYYDLGHRERPGHPRMLSEADLAVIKERIGKRGRPNWIRGAGEA
jgi:transposase